MPNWCQNRVTISGDTEAVTKFKEAVEGLDEDGNLEEFSFHKIIPMPTDLVGTTSPSKTFKTTKEVKEYNANVPEFEGRKVGMAMTDAHASSLRDKYGCDNWYDWSCDNWGVKWPASYIDINDESDDYIVYTFDTPWGPPNGIYNLLVAQHPDVHISWFWDEPGMEMAGYLNLKGGN